MQFEVMSKLMQKIVILMKWFSIYFSLVVFIQNADAQVKAADLLKSAEANLLRVPEFEFIRQEAKKLGVSVYLFGGTAASYLHYVRLDIERREGRGLFQDARFDYDFTNIYRGNQDLDIVVDADSEVASRLTGALLAKYPNFIGDRQDWEVRLLRQKMGDKEALLASPEFLNQHSDSNSIGLVEITDTSSTSIVRDLKDWNNVDNQFLNDVADKRISFYFSDRHESTKRYRQGNNPPILAAIRFIAKLTQFELTASEGDLELIRKIIQRVSVGDLNNYSEKKALEFGLKALLNSPNLEFAHKILRDLGLREKLIEIDGNNVDEIKSVSWWMSRIPLPSFKVGQGTGVTALELSLDMLAHETNSFDSYESIIKSSEGKANVFTSRQGFVGESAIHGEGFYTLKGQRGARGTNITINFRIKPEAREGSDFEVFGDVVLIKNKSAIEVMYDSLSISLDEYFDLLIEGGIASYNIGYIERLSRKFSRDASITILNCEAQKNKILNLSEESQNKTLYTAWFSLKCSQNFPEVVQNLLRQRKHISVILDNVVLNTAWKFNPSLLDQIVNLDSFSEVGKNKIRRSGVLYKHSRELHYSQNLLEIFLNTEVDPALVPYLAKAFKTVDFIAIERDFNEETRPEYKIASFESRGILLALVNAYSNLPLELESSLDELLFNHIIGNNGFWIHKETLLNPAVLDRKETKREHKLKGEFITKNTIASAYEVASMQSRLKLKIRKRKWKSRGMSALVLAPSVLTGLGFYTYGGMDNSIWAASEGLAVGVSLVSAMVGGSVISVHSSVNNLSGNFINEIKRGPVPTCRGILN